MQNIAYIGIGSNIGERKDNCKKAIEFASQFGDIRIIAQSSFYETEPVGEISQDWFINVVIKIKTSLTPQKLLKRLMEIENRMGRIRVADKGPRIIDLDILFYNDIEIDKDSLKIPHPRFHKREFVLVPMSEIAPSYQHPTLKLSILELLTKVDEKKLWRKL